MSPLGGFRQRSVFGPAVSSKYSRHRGRVKVGGKFKGVNEAPSKGILTEVERSVMWTTLVEMEEQGSVIPREACAGTTKGSGE